ncbi:MAG TPA: cation-translocating P-type ATPase [Verrucomicrobiae bacterium]|nr:cation-translocating P-type ATPase [Verrucomicrobiae bacterium]
MPSHEFEPCVLKTAASLLTSNPLLKAISINRSQGRLSVATIGGSLDLKVREEIARTIGATPAVSGTDTCKLLKANTGCSECGISLEPIRKQGFVIAREKGETTIARASCPTAPSFWLWQGFPLPTIAPREVRIPEAEAELKEWKARASAAALCGIFGLAAYVLRAGSWPTILYSLAFAAGGLFAAKEAWSRIRERVLDVHFLMLAVAGGSAAVGAWGEGAMLLFLFSASGALESYAMGRTQREIRSLFRTAPKTASVLDSNGQETELPVEELRQGQKLLVKPGAQFPVDAEIVKGSTAADESTLTGEATPVEKQIGDTVLAGTLNLWGAIEAVVLRPVQESALEKVIRLIREAQHLKAPSQRFTDKFGTGYTYAVLGVTLLMFLVWWQVMGLPAFASTEANRSAFYRAMTLLVVASPCALVLSIPSAVLAAIAWGAKRGILFRGGAAVEKLAQINVVALDKTGTLTTGELDVESVQSFPDGRESEVAQLAFAMERHSTHPLARAITRYGKQQGLRITEFDNFESATGLGLEAKLEDRTARLGRREWVAAPMSHDPRWKEMPRPLHTEAGLSEVWVADGNLLGRILLRDDIRPQAAPVLDALQNLGVHPVVLTGDRPGAALALQRKLGLKDVRSELKPEGKVEAIRKFMAEGKRVAMVGDGVNDAPSLAMAHVGVAMGARGSDAALEQAEIILMHDRLENFLAALHLSRKARKVIRQNLVISLGTVAVLVGFAAFGQIPLTLGVLGHEGSTVIVVLNSLRLLFVRTGADKSM